MKKLVLTFRGLITEGVNSASPLAIEELLLLKKELIASIYRCMMGFGKSNINIRQLHFLQRETILLLDMLFCTESKASLNEFCKVAKDCLQEILEILQRYKNGFFDMEQVMPLYLREETIQEFDKKIPCLKGALKAKKLSAEFQEMVLNPFMSFAKQHDPSYRQKEYLLNILEKLPVTLRDKELAENGCLNLLLINGFNSLAFNEFYLRKITLELEGLYDLEEQLNCLYHYKKALCTIPKKLKEYYDPHNASSKAILLKYLESEISDIYQKQQWCTPSTYANLTSVSSVNYQIKTSLSVDSLAYLIRLLIETDAIEAQPRSALLAFLAAHVQTRGKNLGQISAESLRTKYKQATHATAMRIRALLARMTKKVDSAYPSK